MSQILFLPCELQPEGAERLLSNLIEDIASGRDLGPRGAQIRALGHSLERASLDLRREAEQVLIAGGGDASVTAADRNALSEWRKSLIGLAEAFAQLGAAARTYPV